MSCREIAALRLGLMRVLGTGTEAEVQHELAELGEAANAPGPLQALAEAGAMQQLVDRFDAAVADLENRVATSAADAPELAYLRALLVLCRSVTLTLERQSSALLAMYAHLEEMHDLTHEIFPGG